MMQEPTPTMSFEWGIEHLKRTKLLGEKNRVIIRSPSDGIRVFRRKVIEFRKISLMYFLQANIGGNITALLARIFIFGSGMNPTRSPRIPTAMGKTE